MVALFRQIWYRGALSIVKLFKFFRPQNQAKSIWTLCGPRPIGKRPLLYQSNSMLTDS